MPLQFSSQSPDCRRCRGCAGHRRTEGRASRRLHKPDPDRSDELRAGDSYTVDGCGFEPGSLVPIEVTEGGGCCMAFNVYADESGRFSLTRAANASGYYRVRASGQHRTGRWIVVAEWSTMVS